MGLRMESDSVDEEHCLVEVNIVKEKQSSYNQ
jgi:hypothetical protein